MIDARPGRPAATAPLLAAEIERRAHRDPLHSFVVDDRHTPAMRWGKPAALAFFTRMCPTLLELRAPRSRAGGGSIHATRSAVTGWRNLRAEAAALFLLLRD